VGKTVSESNITDTHVGYLPKSMSSIVAWAPSTIIVLGDGPFSTWCR